MNKLAKISLFVTGFCAGAALVHGDPLMAVFLSAASLPIMLGDTVYHH